MFYDHWPTSYKHQYYWNDCNAFGYSKHAPVSLHRGYLWPHLLTWLNFIPAWISHHVLSKVWMTLIIHSQTSTSSLKFGKEQVIIPLLNEVERGVYWNEIVRLSVCRHNPVNALPGAILLRLQSNLVGTYLGARSRTSLFMGDAAY